MQQTRAVRSSIASANRSSGMRPSGSGRTWTTSAPRSSCACAICPIVGNSYSLITIRFRSPRRSSAETSPLTPCETDVVTATSSGEACTRPANDARAASFRSTQNSHSAPFSSQPSSHSSTAARTRFESAPCEHEFAYTTCSKIGNSPRIAWPTLIDRGTPCEAPRAREGPRPRPRARPARSRARTRGPRWTGKRSRSARRRARRPLTRAPAG